MRHTGEILPYYKCRDVTVRLLNLNIMKNNNILQDIQNTVDNSNYSYTEHRENIGHPITPVEKEYINGAILLDGYSYKNGSFFNEDNNEVVSFGNDYILSHKDGAVFMDSRNHHIDTQEANIAKAKLIVEESLQTTRFLRDGKYIKAFVKDSNKNYLINPELENTLSPKWSTYLKEKVNSLNGTNTYNIEKMERREIEDLIDIAEASSEYNNMATLHDSERGYSEGDTFRIGNNISGGI